MNTTNKAVLLIISFTIALIFFSCEKGTEPEQLKPGSRDFIWTVDTLDAATGNFYSFRHMVGNTASDLWLGTSDATQGTGLWHFDGEKWEVSPAPGSSYAKWAIYIFEDNTLFMGGESSQISKRENGEWTQTSNLSVVGFNGIAIFDIYGKSKDNIYAVGVAYSHSTDSTSYKQIGVIFHYDGINWAQVETAVFAGPLHLIRYHKPSGKYLIFATKDFHEGYEDMIVKFDGVNIEETSYGNIGLGISEINEELYINSDDNKVYKFNGDSLYLWKDFSNTEFQTNFFGDSESNFINHSSKGIGHYNGVDYKTVYESNLELSSIAFVENEVFVVGVDYRNYIYIVIHGKLKE